MIGAAFDLLSYVRVLEPVRLVDLAAVSGIPRPTVHRLLSQLIEVGAVRREGTRYRLGLTLLKLGEEVGPQRRLRMVARRPLAELAAVTGAGVTLTAPVSDEPVLLDFIDARCSLGLIPELGAPVRAGTAMARVHGLGAEVTAKRPPALAADLGGVSSNVSCLGRGAVAARRPGRGDGAHPGNADASSVAFGRPRYRDADLRLAVRSARA